MRRARSATVSDLIYDPYKKDRKQYPGKTYPLPFVAREIPTNITVHGSSLRFQFYYNKQQMIQRYCSLADVSSQPLFQDEADSAARQYEVIIDKIDRGHMTDEMLATLMPDSKFAKDFKGTGIGSGTTFINVADKYIKQLEYRFKRAEVSASTLQVAKKMVGSPVLALPHADCSISKLKKSSFNDLVIHKITTNEIKDFVDYLHHDVVRDTGQVGYSKSYVSNILNYVKQVLITAINSNFIKDSPAASVKLDQKSRTGKVEDKLLFSPKEREKIIRTAYDIDKPYLAELFRFQMYMGLRTSEVLALAWEDMLDNDRIVVRRAYTAYEYGDTKTELSHRILGIPKKAMQALKAMKNETFDLEPRTVDVYRNKAGAVVKEELRFVFMNFAEKKGQVSSEPRPWKESTLRKAWNRVRKESGIDKPISHTRHSFASTLLTKGATPMEVARLLGHTDDHMVKKRYGTMTDVYDEGLFSRTNAILDSAD